MTSYGYARASATDQDHAGRRADAGARTGCAVIREGIEHAKARGVCEGRRPVVDPTWVRALHAEEVRPSETARQLEVGFTTA